MRNTVHATAIAVVVALSATGCQVTSASSKGEGDALGEPVTVVAAQSVPPLLAAGALTADDPDLYEVELGMDPDFLRAQLASGSADLAVMPTEAAAALYNGGLDIALVGVLDLSLLHVVAPIGTTLGELESLHIAFPGDTADQVVQTVIEAQGLDLELEYHPGLPEILAGLADGDISAAVLPEHFATLASGQSSGELVSVADLREEWAIATGTTSKPQIAVVSIAEFAEVSPERLSGMIDALEGDLTSGEISDVVAELTEVAPEFAAEVINRLDASFLSSEEAREPVEAYLSALIARNTDIAGGELPDDGFYAER